MALEQFRLKDKAQAFSMAWRNPIGSDQVPLVSLAWAARPRRFGATGAAGSEDAGTAGAPTSAGAGCRPWSSVPRSRPNPCCLARSLLRARMLGAVIG